MGNDKFLGPKYYPCPDNPNLQYVYNHCKEILHLSLDGAQSADDLVNVVRKCADYLTEQKKVTDGRNPYKDVRNAMCFLVSDRYLESSKIFADALEEMLGEEFK